MSQHRFLCPACATQVRSLTAPRSLRCTHTGNVITVTVLPNGTRQYRLKKPFEGRTLMATTFDIR